MKPQEDPLEIPRHRILIRPDNLGRPDYEATSAGEWLELSPQPAFMVICGCRHLISPCQASDISKAVDILEPKTMVERGKRHDHENVLRYFYEATYTGSILLRRAYR